MFQSMKHFTQNTNQTDKGTKKLPNVSTAKEQGAATEARLMKKIELAKKKYVQEYRKMLMEIKTINLDSDLPRIKYIEQNETSDRINMMHMGSKLWNALSSYLKSLIFYVYTTLLTFVRKD